LIGCELAAPTTDLVARADFRQHLPGLPGGQGPAGAARNQVGEVSVQSAHGLGSQAHQLVSTMGQQPQRHRAIVGAHHRQVRGLQTDHGDRMRVDVVGLSAVAAGVDPNQRTTACGNIHHHLVLGPETLARCLPVPLHPSIAHVRGRHRRENTRSSPKPAAVFANSRRASTLPSASTTTTASIRLCGPNTDHHLRHRCSFGHRIHSSEEGSATASVFSSPSSHSPHAAPGGSQPFASHTSVRVGSRFASHPQAPNPRLACLGPQVVVLNKWPDRARSAWL
jgi:hypothetical protein